jgi:hypothetical protein
VAKPAAHRLVTSAKDWKRRAPKSSADRRHLRDRCGSSAFLVPGRLKYPVMAKAGPCQLDCIGLRAAALRAQLQRRPQLAAKARRIAKRSKCVWAV